MTDGGKISKSIDNKEIDYMETILIGMAFHENNELKNTKVAKLAGKLVFPITGGEGRGKPSEAVRTLKRTFNY